MKQQRMFVYYYLSAHHFLLLKQLWAKELNMSFKEKDIITSNRFLNGIPINAIQRLKKTVSDLEGLQSFLVQQTTDFSIV